jgi:hypothetical protein
VRSCRFLFILLSKKGCASPACIELLAHQPHAAPDEVLRAAGLEIGKKYPHPVVGHATARDLALAAFEQIKTSALSA